MENMIAIIGGGNLGTAMAEGLVNSAFSKPENIIVTKRNTTTLSLLASKGVIISNNNVEAVTKASWIILAIKPFQIKEVLEEIKPMLNKDKHVLISVVTGVWINEIQEIVGADFQYLGLCRILL